MRLFVALEIPASTREALRALVAQLAPVCAGARWLRPEGIHLTLKFIGEVSDEAAQNMRGALHQISMPAAVELEFRGWGFFPDARRPQVFWAGVHANSVLEKLADEIDGRLAPLGCKREAREFRPHLTLARFKSAEGLHALQSELVRLEKPSAPSGGASFGKATIEEFQLMQSTLRPTGAVHTTLQTFRFVAARTVSAAGART